MIAAVGAAPGKMLGKAAMIKADALRDHHHAGGKTAERGAEIARVEPPCSGG
jgi:hypothetical protein